MRSTSRRLLAVMAMVAAIVVPASGAGAQVEDHECDGYQYNPADNNHVLYGLTEGTPVNTAGKMRVDLSAMGVPPSGTFVLFWDGGFTPGTNGVEVIGSPYDDVICGTDGDDDIWGRQGNDRIFGFGSDSDWSGVLGDGSGDQLFGNQGNDFVTPGDGNDTSDMVPGFNEVVLGGGPGNDVIFAGAGDFSLARGGTGNDTMFASDGLGDFQHLRGGDGDDTMFASGSEGVDVFGSLGNDTLFGGGAADQDLNGNNGDDTLEGGSGDDQILYGGGGDDTLIAHSAADNMGLFGGRDDDHISNLGADNDQLADGGPGNDTIVGVQTGDPDGPTDHIWAFGGEGNDTIIGSDDVDGDDDRLFGDYANAAGQVVGIAIRGFAPAYFIDATATGDDWIEGRDGADFIYGGPGNDTLYGNEPKSGAPNDGLDLADGDDDDLFGDDGDDVLFGNGETGCGEDDFANGGANFAAGDSSWGFEDLPAYAINVEHLNDVNACPVLP